MIVGRARRRLSPAALCAAALGMLALAPAAGSPAVRLASDTGVAPAPRRQTPPQPAPVAVLVVYYSVTGNTEKMARAVAEGVRQVRGASAALKKPSEVTSADLKRADAIVLGSPTYWANMAAPMKAFIDDWFLEFKVPLIDKVGGSFSSGGTETGGKEAVLYSLNLAMTNAGLIVVGPVVGGFGQAGVSAVEPVGDKALGECRALGQRVAGLAGRLKAAAAAKDGPSQ